MFNRYQCCLCVLGVLLLGISSSARAQSSQPSTSPSVDEPTTAATAEPANQSVRIAHVRLGGEILESPPGFQLFPEMGGQETLRDWLHRLATIRKDPKVTAVALEIDSVRMNWTQGQELADAVRRLSAKKTVYAHIHSCRASQYLVASAADHVSMEPAGTIYITGLAAELLFYRDALNWLGVKPQMIQIGPYKGAAEPLMRSEPSKELIEGYNWILDDLYEQLCSQIASQRSLSSIRQAEAAVDDGPLCGEQAIKHKFVDKLICRSDWQEFVTDEVRNSGERSSEVHWKKNYARKSRRAVDLSNPFALLSTLFGGDRGERIREPTIAIVHADGMIVQGSGGEGLFGQRMVGARTMTRIFDEIREDDRIKAVVFRINSPGGSALASELIFQAVRKCSQVKPVIVSIAQVGGSGGYYIAVAGREIYADAAAIVGSIGVISGKLAISGLLEKLQIGRHEMTRGRNAGLWMSRPWNEREEQVIRDHARKTYDLFVRRVAKGRAGRIDDLESVAGGRIFTARQAVKNGLIDKVGGLRDAVRAAQRAAGLTKCHFISLPRSRSLMDLLVGERDISMLRPRQVDSLLLQEALKRSAGAKYLLNLVNQLDGREVLMAMPAWLEIHP